MIAVLNEREFPVGELRLLASGRSAGRTLSIDGRTLEIGEATPEAFDGVDIALFSAGADISRELAPAAAARGATVIDNSSAWRMDPKIPLVVSQVNPDDLEGHEGIIANPNCSTMQMAPVLMALRDAVGLERVVVDTYQSVSGTGADALAELEGQIRAHVAGEPKRAEVYPHPIAFNALPEIDVFLPNGYTKEEWKVVTENRKILGLPELRISCTAVRIPVFVSHSEAIHVETRDPITPEQPGRCSPACPASSSRTTRRRTTTRSRARPPGATRSSSGGSGATSRSRTTAGSPSGSSRDNLRKGAATNAIELAEILVGRSWVEHASARGARPYRAHGASGGRRREHGVTDAERRAALEAIAAEVRVCTRCRLHVGRTRAVPGEGNASTEVVFVGEGPGFNEDKQGRPFVGRAGDLLVKLLAHIGWRREDVFITNIVKCRPPDNRDPEPDEIAACAPYLTRQLQVLDPAVVVTLGRFSMARFMPGVRISQAHGTVRPVDPGHRAPVTRLVLAMYHPAAALRSSAVERESYDDAATIPAVLLDARARRAGRAAMRRRPSPTIDGPETAPRLPLTCPRRRPGGLLPAGTGREDREPAMVAAAAPSAGEPDPRRDPAGDRAHRRCRPDDALLGRDRTPDDDTD